MKKPIQLLLTIASIALWQTSLQAATKYWDIDGPTPGAGGAAPEAIWDTGVTTNWTTSAAGTTAATTWDTGDDAVFSAGTNATGAFAVVLDNTVFQPQFVGNLTVQEGALTIASEPGYMLNIGGGVAGKGIISVSNNLNFVISSELDYLNASGDDSGKLTKTGTGTLTLSAPNSIQNTLEVLQGTLVAMNNTALGSTLVPTVVSNGATLRTHTSNCGEPAILNGSGHNNYGALRSTIGGSSTWSGVTLGSDATIVMDGSGTWTWSAATGVDGTSTGGSPSVTFGGTNAFSTIRMNNGYRAIVLNNGVINKGGALTLRFETPCLGVTACNFTGGIILTRTAAGGNFLPVGSPINISSGAVGFDTGFGASPSIWSPMVLGAGANPMFLIRTNSAGAQQSWTQTGVISGPGGFTKTNSGFGLNGVMNLVATNTYSGNTIIQGGTVMLGANGSVSNTALIDLRRGDAVFNAELVPNFVLQSAQTIAGIGTVMGNVTANGTIAPGSSVGTLTFSNNLVVAGNLAIEVDKSLTPSNDVIAVLGTLNNVGTGTLSVAWIGGAPLAVGDTFQVFNQPLPNGNAITVTGAGAGWANNLATDGTIQVTVAPPPPVPATNLTVTAISPNSVGLGAQGYANAAYSVYASTNIALPMSNWWKLGTTNASAGGVIQFLDSQATNSQRFYRFGQP